MKTNVVLQSNDRLLFGEIVRQETKTQMLNISDLERIASKRNEALGYSIKHIPELICRHENVERMYYVLKNQGNFTVDLSTFIELIENDGVITTLKKLGAWKTTGARHTKTSWANPYIWVLIALELSPEIYGEAIMWLTDKLILSRIEAGDFCKSLNKSIAKFNPTGNQYAQIAKAINIKVFGESQPGIRNTGTREQLKQVANIEDKIAFAIDNGFINSIDEAERTINNLKH